MKRYLTIIAILVALALMLMVMFAVLADEKNPMINTLKHNNYQIIKIDDVSSIGLIIRTNEKLYFLEAGINPSVYVYGDGSNGQFNKATKKLLPDEVDIIKSGYVLDNEPSLIYLGTATSPTKLFVVDVDNNFKILYDKTLDKNHNEAVSVFSTEDNNGGYIFSYTLPGTVVGVDNKLNIKQQKSWDNIFNLSLLKDNGNYYLIGYSKDGGSIISEINLQTMELSKDNWVMFDNRVGQGIVNTQEGNMYFPDSSYPPTIIGVDMTKKEVIAKKLQVENNNFTITKLFYLEDIDSYLLLTDDSPCRYIITDAKFDIIVDRQIEEATTNCMNGSVDHENNVLYAASNQLSAEKPESYLLKINFLEDLGYKNEDN